MKRILLPLAFLFACAQLVAAPLTNDDVIKMSKAGLNEAVIITAIENSEPKFDSTPQGLIDLSKAGVTQDVINALIKRNSAPVAAAASGGTAPAAAADVLTPSQVMLLDGDEERAMRYLIPQTHSKIRGFGWGGMATYAVLRGSTANERIKSGQPSFLVSVPNQAQVESYVTIANFAVRDNNTREVMIGGGFMGYSSGVHPDRVIAYASAKTPDQSKAQSGFTIYKITPSKPLAKGEYAVILYTGEMHGLVSMWFADQGNAYFDFGI
jgi:hypothetical protein